MSEPKKRKTQAAKLIDLANRLYSIAPDRSGDIYAVPRTGPRIAVPVQGQGSTLTAHLTREFFERDKKAPSKNALTQAMDVLKAQADVCDPIDVHLRCARWRDEVIVDLGDDTGRVLRIRPRRWEMAQEAPGEIVFRRTHRLTAPMPEPDRAAKPRDLDRLRDLLGLGPEAWDFVRGWLVAAWMPDVSLPILTMLGPKGTGKTSLAKMLVRIADPSTVPTRPLPRDLADWATTAAGSRVVCLDNISRINEETSDALCRAVTGDGGVKRRLYSDSDLVVVTFRLALILTSIDPGALRGDLVERLLPVEMPPIDDRRRLKEADIEREFEAALPRILGGLISTVVKVLASEIATPAELPRMADFGEILARLDDVTGSTSLGRYKVAIGDLEAGVLDADPVAETIVAFMAKRAEWVGGWSELYAALTPSVNNWPANSKGLSSRIRRIATELERIHGIQMFEPPRGNVRQVGFRKLR